MWAITLFVYLGIIALIAWGAAYLIDRFES